VVLVLVSVILLCTTPLITGCAKKYYISSRIKNSADEYTASQLCRLFDELDDKVNEGKGYSKCLNTDGFPTGALLAWSESYLMQAYANMYKATGDVKYLDKLQAHTLSVLANRDDKIGRKDYKGELAPSWGTDRYTPNHEWMHFVAHTGMITYPMLEFVKLVKESNIEKYLVGANTILTQAEQAVRYHDKEWRQDYYVYPDDFYKKDYIVAMNQQAAIGRSLLLLYELTGNEEYLNRARLIAEFINAKGILQGNDGGFLLLDRFTPGKTEPDSTIADISHATITIHFAYLAYENGIIFTEGDMAEFTKTIKSLAQANDNHFPKYLDGTGNFDYEIAAGQYAFLAEFDSEIYNSITDLLFNHLKVDQTAKYMQEDWWGTVMLSLSRLVLEGTQNRPGLGRSKPAT